MRRMPIDTGASQQVKLYMTQLTAVYEDDDIYQNYNILSNKPLNDNEETNLTNIITKLKAGETSKIYFISGGAIFSNADYTLATAISLKVDTKLKVNLVEANSAGYIETELTNTYTFKLYKSIEL